MKLNLKQFLCSLSLCLDFVEIDILGATTNHSRRVFYISLRMAEFFNLTNNEKFDLFTYAVLHDNGLSEEAVFNREAYKNLTRLEAIEQLSAHCEIGENNIKDLPFIQSRNIIKYHHESYDGSGFFGLSGDEIPLMAQIIKIADYVDNLFHFENPNFENRENILRFINQNRKKQFSNDIVEAFNRLSSYPAFWLDLQNPFIVTASEKIIPEKIYHFSTNELLNFTKIISRIIDCKSEFTMKHSSGLAKKTEHMCHYYNLDYDTTVKAIVAANLHDLGKLAIPNSILDKPSKLNREETEIIKQHTYYTRVALNEISGFEKITEWAANHHEKLNGSGYPYGITGDKLDFMSRLMGALDIYQALTEKRPYRKPMQHTNAIGILKNMADSGLLDKGIVESIDRAFK